MFSIFSSGRLNQTALLLKPRVRVCVPPGSVFLIFQTKTHFKAHFLSTNAHQSKKQNKKKRVFFRLHPSPDLLCKARGSPDSCGFGPLTGCGLHFRLTSVGFTFPQGQPAGGSNAPYRKEVSELDCKNSRHRIR